LFYGVKKRLKQPTRQPEKEPKRKPEKREKINILEVWSHKKAKKPLQSLFYQQMKWVVLVNKTYQPTNKTKEIKQDQKPNQAKTAKHFKTLSSLFTPSLLICTRQFKDPKTI
jgi:hypothetical protein